ncbi:hypothetical protein RCH09_003427 [Actimicrobium sp. GrIS 1.19]|uniref:hypothetical protein n=1 Tax=Actimicrobium sp. GrIS 1.19 TaxID=3071708 RepID=UPI002DFD4FD0|nr:hypothetical protein [Actimicrobium sp. GrIS 1.19]
MHLPAHVSSEKRQRSAPAIIVDRRSAAVDRPFGNRPPPLRQIDTFSTTLGQLRRYGYLSACALLLFTLVCTTLFINAIDVHLFFTAGATALSLQAAWSGFDYLNEKKQTEQRFWQYLDGFSYRHVEAMRRTAMLSPWTASEIDKYLAVAHLKW